MNSLPNFIITEPAQDSESRQNLASWYTPGLSDGLGDRLLMFDNTTSSSLELLRFKREFGTAPGFEAALRRRVDELSSFSHPAFAKVRAVEWLGDSEGLALVSNHIVGRRLSEIVQDARGPVFAAELIRQLAPALATLQRQGPGIAHGALTPERIVVTPEGQLVIVEHVLGSAVGSLRLPARRLRGELGIPVPAVPDGAALGPHADVFQLGYLALSLLVGRHVRPAGGADIVNLLEDFERTNPRNGLAPLHLRRWIERALQVNGSTFTSAREAEIAVQDWPEHRKLEDEPHRRLLEIHMAPESRDAKPPMPQPDFSESDFAFLTEDEVERNATDVSAPSAASALVVESAPAVAHERPNKIEPITRGSAVAFDQRAPRPAPKVSEAVEPFRVPSKAYAGGAEPVPVPHVSQAVPVAESEATKASSVRRPIGGAQVAIIGLVLLSIVEALVIVVLMYTRPPNDLAAVVQAGRGAGTVTAAGEQSATDSAASPAAAAPTGQGRLEITSDPPGARVTVNNTPRGTTPLTLSVDPGEHSVVIATDDQTTRRTMTVTAGSSSVLMASMTPSAPAATAVPGTTGGWLTVSAPGLELQILEDGKLLGTTRAERIMLPAGRHQLQLANTGLGFQENLSVDIQPGRTITQKVNVPNGSVFLNALPWANVWLDGQSLGTTPFANLAVPIGPHEVVMRHPQLGERRRNVVVTTKPPLRIVMDFNNKAAQ